MFSSEIWENTLLIASTSFLFLKSAIANAGQNDAVNVDDLIVSDARVDGGPLVHGRPTFRPGPMGRAMTIRRRTSHFRIGVSEKTAAEVK